MFTCLNCGKEEKNKKNCVGKFCSNACCGEYRFNQNTVMRFYLGEIKSNKTLKKCLVQKNKEVCTFCGLGNIWNNKDISLQVDHVDGDSDNNLPENLRLLCPNCHSQTPTYGNKERGTKALKQSSRNKYFRKYKTK